MRLDSERHHRRSLRLKGYDYSRHGAYFVTICTKNRECLFGEIANGSMWMNPFGDIVRACWDDLPCHYQHMELDAFVVMPNHIHGIIVLADTVVRAGLKPAPTGKRHGLPEIIRAFKTFSSRRINDLHNASGTRLWQRGYYEHIIRNENSLNNIRNYIQFNPAIWQWDRENPEERQPSCDEIDRVLAKHYGFTEEL